MEPPNKGHFGDTAFVLISEVVALFGGQKCINAIYGKGTWRSDLCGEVVPFSEGQRFRYITYIITSRQAN